MMHTETGGSTRQDSVRWSRRGAGSGSRDARPDRDARNPSNTAPERPRGRPDADLGAELMEEATDWQQVGIFGAGLLLGALIGAGAALLTAPRSGASTRSMIARAGRRARNRAATRAADGWAGLSDELSLLRARTRRDVHRGLRAGRRDVRDALGELDAKAQRGLQSMRGWRRKG